MWRAILFWVIAAFGAAAILMVLSKFFGDAVSRYRRPQRIGMNWFAKLRAAVTWKALEAFLLAVVAAGGLLAFQTYKENNGNSLLIALEDRDRQLGSSYMQDRNISDFPAVSQDGQQEREKPPKSLMLIYSDQPDLSIAAFQECGWKTRLAIKDWAYQYMKFAAGIEARWNSIEELHSMLWSTEGMRNENYNRARAMVFHAVNHLYIVHDAFQARSKGYFNDEELGMWAAYLNDLGTSPFFLVALFDGVKYSYAMPTTFDQIREYMSERPNLRCVATSLYPSYFEAKKPNK